MYPLRALFAITLYLVPFSLLATDKSHHHDVGEFLSVESSVTISQKEAHDIITAADWKHATKVDILFDDDFYEPEELVLTPGQAYILKIKNVGEKRHDISGEEFFSNIVVKQISNKGLAVSAYHIEAIHVLAEEEVEVWLVPKNVGEFPFICTLPGHMHDGMEGMLTVKEKKSTD